jgi:hypothetical protein
MSEEQEFAPAWRPEKAGDRVAGKVVDIVGLDRGWGVYPCVTLETADGAVSVHAFHSVLRQELARRRPKRGDDLEVVYAGKKESPGSANGYHAYKVIGGQQREYNWDADLAPEERQALADPPIAPRYAVPADAPADHAPVAQVDPEPDTDDLPF